MDAKFGSHIGYLDSQIVTVHVVRQQLLKEIVLVFCCCITANKL